jgi:NAD(P)-dependent dehydrogenase (short-subunit alcohol dehydrogenase family)
MSALKDKVVIVTGGSSGIGRAAALEEAAGDHRDISAVVADAASPADAARTVAEAIEAHGRLDVLVNNAGAGAILPLAEATAKQIQSIFAVNVVGASLLATAALPHLKASKGAIINISSTYGHKPAAGLSHYAASKAALEHLTRCWALELAPQGVRVNAVAAGPTESGALTGMMGLSPEHAAAIEAQEREAIPLKRRGAQRQVPDSGRQPSHWRYVVRYVVPPIGGALINSKGDFPCSLASSASSCWQRSR